MSQREINNKKAIEAIKKAYHARKISKSQAEWLMTGVKI